MVNILMVELDRGDESDWKEILAFLKGKCIARCQGCQYRFLLMKRTGMCCRFPAWRSG